MGFQKNKRKRKGKPKQRCRLKGDRQRRMPRRRKRRRRRQKQRQRHQQQMQPRRPLPRQLAKQPASQLPPKRPLGFSLRLAALPPKARRPKRTCSTCPSALLERQRLTTRHPRREWRKKCRISTFQPEACPTFLQLLVARLG